MYKLFPHIILQIKRIYTFFRENRQKRKKADRNGQPLYCLEVKYYCA